MNSTGPQPGWYPNPGGTGQRYWDGAAWTDDFHDSTPPKRGLSGRKVGFLIGAFLVTALALGATATGIRSASFFDLMIGVGAAVAAIALWREGLRR